MVPKPNRTQRSRWSFSQWMVAAVYATMGTFSVMAAYTMVVDKSPHDLGWEYPMWVLNGIGLLALLLWFVTDRR